MTRRETGRPHVVSSHARARCHFEKIELSLVTRDSCVSSTCFPRDRSAIKANGSDTEMINLVSKKNDDKSD